MKLEGLKKKIENMAWTIGALTIGSGACAIIWFFGCAAVIFLGD